ncbi:MAG: SIR2 family protein [Candidatus Aminicenantes bacterium]|nr:SIR2 family protein [Candidatus Aminicenantes bacterium]NIM83845.1 SIR2 family protein [Candidatus Aminicenantes bacterium]NIN23309.1 SIR2 family protein [Candidatus Aminicenantes bacterium]NIN47013.1 SIR2 family protein [Candidatus Aminicenantes bacterium]NIN89935.1 SIR2 family protein [Candidatus Aminicenantes bacterium]
MTQKSSLAPHLSRQHEAWKEALFRGEARLLANLASSDDPAAALFELETYINGLYQGAEHPLAFPRTEIQSKVRLVLPYIEEIRDRLGWRIRDFDLGLLRFIRRSSMLSPVLGAGVSMGAGAPSWSELVRLMLEETLDNGLELYESVPAADNSAQPPFESLPEGDRNFERIIGIGTRKFEQRVSEVKRYTAQDEQIARKVLAEVKARGFSTDVEVLMQGAQVCYDLCGQDLFRLLTRIIYTRAKEPSETHRAIAELAHGQEVPDRGRGLFPGWDSIITYNIDALMSEALTEESVPHVAWAMSGDKLRGDPDELAQNSPWHQSVYHLHGYTPRRLFRITDILYVFSTSQYLTTYKGPRSEILHTVKKRFLANPVHIALYVGCSFADPEMNGLLREAFEEHPGRYHYALLKWPYDRQGREPATDEVKAESAKYLEFGVRPVWFDDFKELPGLIRQLQ